MRRILAVLAMALAVSALGTKAEAKRVALVIGNDRYQHLEPLQKAVADAHTYADVLKLEGFDEVTLKTDATRDEMDEALAAFFSEIAPGDTAVFAYSGHGWSDGRENYLVATDAPTGGSEEFLARISIPLRNGANGILDDMQRRGAALMVGIIDACRDNPFKAPDGTRSIGLTRGLSRVDPPSGTFVVFSAGTDEKALDRLSDGDADPNSVFTRTFAPLMRSGVSLQEATKEAQEQVAALARSAGHEQRPAYYDEVLGKACLASACGLRAAPPKPAPQEDEAAAYQAALGVNSPEAWDAFLKYHADGFYADLARAARAKLASAPPAAVPPTPLAAPPLITECDRLGAIFLDPDKPRGFRGRGTQWFGNEAAIAPCRQAAADHPEIRRFKTQLAFALLQGGKAGEARPLLEEASDAGSATAMLGLGLIYQRGAEGIEKNDAESVRWLERSIAAGSLVAHAFLAAHALDQSPKDQATARREIDLAMPLLDKASAAGDPDAAAIIALIYLDSELEPHDPVKAGRYLLEGVKRQSEFVLDAFRKADDLPAETRLAVKKILADAGYLTGEINDQIDDQTKTALKAWVAAGAQGPQLAKESEAVTPDSGRPAPVVKPPVAEITDCDRIGAILLDPDKPVRLRGHDTPRLGNDAAVEPCRKAITEHPEVRRFKTQLAFALIQTGKADEARPLLEDAAKAGSSAAMFGLAMLLDSGEGGVEKDQAESRRWLQQSIDAGNAVALIISARRAIEGEPKDEAKARQAVEQALAILQKAMDAGDPDAPGLAAWLYLDDRFGAKDDAKAATDLVEGVRRQSAFAVHAFRDQAGNLSAETRLAVKKILADAGYLTGELNADFDDKTKAALDAWLAAADREGAVAKQ